MSPRQLAFASLLALSVSAAAAPLVRNARPLPKHGSWYVPEVYAGDFGGDGASDLLTVTDGQSIRVLVNEGTGIFGAPVITPITEGGIADAAAGDIDADGDLDLVLSAASFGQQLVVYRNDGAGAFTRGAVIGSQRTGEVGIADFTGDGHADLVLVRSDVDFFTYDRGEALVFPGDGSGAFGAPSLTVLHVEPWAMDMADVNGDGKRDLLAAGRHGVELALGQGNGTFVTTLVSDTPGLASDLAAGDFNNDGDADFVVASDPVYEIGTLRVFLGGGNGSFTPADNWGMQFSCVTVADVDGDGNADLLGGALAGNFAWLRGRGDGTFDALQPWQSPHVTDIAAADFNRDDVADVVFLGGGDGHQLYFVAGVDPGTFDAYRIWLPAGAALDGTDPYKTLDTAAADVNGDGAPDVVSLVARDGFADVHLSVMLNAKDGAATLLAPILTPTVFAGFELPRLAHGDINGDGKKDVVVAAAKLYEEPRAQVLLGRNDGAFDALPQFPIDVVGVPWLADVTGDAVLDLLVSHDDLSQRTTTRYRGTGSGSFADPLAVPFGLDAVADVNGDARRDLFGHDSRGTIVALNNGSGTAFAQTIYPDGTYPGIGAVEDFDGDGHRDLFLVHYTGVSFRFGNGDGTFDDAHFFNMTRTAIDVPLPFVRTGDFDGDGERDVVRGHEFFLGHGGGTFDGFAAVDAQSSGAFDVADFDGNGTDDLAIVSGDDGVTIVRTALGSDPANAASIEFIDVTGAIPVHAEPVFYRAAIADAGPNPMGAVVFAGNGVPFALLRAPATQAAATVHQAGPLTVTATYTGDGHYAPAIATLQYDVAKAVPNMFLTAGSGTIFCGSDLPIRVFFSAPIAQWLPKPGSIEFREGNTLLLRAPALRQNHAIGGLTPGTHTISVLFPGDANYASVGPLTFEATVLPTIDPSISAGGSVFASGTGYASANAYAGATYQWTITNGTIDSGQGTAKIRYTAGASGEVTLGLTITRDQCGGSAMRTVSIVAQTEGATMLYLLTPCRAIDTRGGAPIADGATRELVLDGVCGIPNDAKSLVVNLTVLAPTDAGWLSLFPANAPWPGTSTINFRAGKTRANNAIVSVAPGARLNLRHNGPPVHYLIDVTGYFR